jgi:peroxiredoxin Q/BCP
MPLIDVGRPAPPFSLPDQRGKTRSLSDYQGRAVVLFFYPEDDTPVCTGEACQFRDHHDAFAKIKTVVLGISPQGVDSHKAFADKHGLTYTLLVDEPGPDGVPPMSAAYGTWGEKNMYGRIVVSMLRTTYLIAPDGTVARRWDRVRTPGHAEKVLEAARALHAGEKLTILGKEQTLKGKPAKKTTRDQGGHAGYSGVLSTKGKKTRNRSTAAQAGAKQKRTRGK